MAYWVKGHQYMDAAKKTYQDQAVIHRFDTLKEAKWFKNQIAHGEILDWGEGKDLSPAERGN